MNRNFFFAKKSMIHISRIPQIMERKDRHGKPVPFSLKYVKVSTGEIIEISNAVLTSTYHYGTVNIMLLESKQLRKLHLPLIVEFNKTQTFI